MSMSEVWADIGRRGKRINYSTRKRLTQELTFYNQQLDIERGGDMYEFSKGLCRFDG